MATERATLPNGRPSTRARTRLVDRRTRNRACAAELCVTALRRLPWGFSSAAHESCAAELAGRSAWSRDVLAQELQLAAGLGQAGVDHVADRDHTHQLPRRRGRGRGGTSWQPSCPTRAPGRPPTLRSRCPGLRSRTRASRGSPAPAATSRRQSRSLTIPTTSPDSLMTMSDPMFWDAICSIALAMAAEGSTRWIFRPLAARTSRIFICQLRHQSSRQVGRAADGPGAPPRDNDERFQTLWRTVATSWPAAVRKVAAVSGRCSSSLKRATGGGDQAEDSGDEALARQLGGVRDRSGRRDIVVLRAIEVSHVLVLDSPHGLREQAGTKSVLTPYWTGLRTG